MATAATVDRSTLRLSEVARHVVIPEGIVDTLWFEVEDRCREFGDTFDAWQDGLGQVTLGIREDGLFAATVGGITYSIPRQVAKTFIVGRIVVALCTIYPNLTVLWTAHRTRTATNTFQKLKGYVTRKQVKSHLEPGRNMGTAIRDANGEQEIPFANGSRILFGARADGFGRGFDEVDIEVFDEAQILSEKALEDMIAATNQSRFKHGALLFFMGTPPRPIDPGEAFSGRRDKALALKGDRPDFSEPVTSGSAVYVECSADSDVGAKGGPSLDDPQQVEIANPSYPHRTPPVAVERLRENLPSDEGWRREGLGVWDPKASVNRLIPADNWTAVQTSEPPPDGIRSFGMVFDFDTDLGALAGSVKHEDGVHLELIDFGPVNIDALAKWMAERWRDLGMIALAGGAGSKAMAQALLDRGVSQRVIKLMTTPEYSAGNAMLEDAIKYKSVTVPAGDESDALEKSVRVSDKKATASGWRWVSTGADGDHLPMTAISIALWAAKTNKRRPGRKTRVRTLV